MTLDWLEVSSQAIAERRITALTDLSAVLFLSVVTDYKRRRRWSSGDDEVSDDQWDDIQKAISQAEHEMITGLIGMIIPHALATFEGVVLPCDGGTYNRVDYEALYAAIDPIYIIDADTFKTPNLVGRFPLGESLDFEIGSEGGEIEHILSVGEMPSHVHGYTQPTFGVDMESVGVPDPTGVGNPPLPQLTDAEGGDEAHNNMPPYTVIRWVIVAG